ncbi:MAG TPA: hypothetical protein VKI65_06730, partial [Gemmataceae bacterium]|nr:hypothetical protein [Gemmataceae bacterium]
LVSAAPRLVSARLPDSRVFPHCGIDRKQHHKSRIANANERGVQSKERLDTSNERSPVGNVSGGRNLVSAVFLESRI